MERPPLSRPAFSVPSWVGRRKCKKLEQLLQGAGGEEITTRTSAVLRCWTTVRRRKKQTRGLMPQRTAGCLPAESRGIAAAPRLKSVAVYMIARFLRPDVVKASHRAAFPIRKVPPACCRCEPSQLLWQFNQEIAILPMGVMLQAFLPPGPFWRIRCPN